MSRQDIADHLGLTIETVSRTLTQMQNAGLVRISGARSVELRQRQALSGLRA
jgi:CRP-like cAMP-binding protein